MSPPRYLCASSHQGWDKIADRRFPISWSHERWLKFQTWSGGDDNLFPHEIEELLDWLVALREDLLDPVLVLRVGFKRQLPAEFVKFWR